MRTQDKDKVEQASRGLLTLIVLGALGLAVYGAYYYTNRLPLAPSPTPKPAPSALGFDYLNEVARRYASTGRTRDILSSLDQFVLERKNNRDYNIDWRTISEAVNGDDPSLLAKMRKKATIEGAIHYFKVNAPKNTPLERTTIEALYHQMESASPDWEKRREFLLRQCSGGDKGNGFISLLDSCAKRIDALTEKLERAPSKTQKPRKRHRALKTPSSTKPPMTKQDTGER